MQDRNNINDIRQNLESMLYGYYIKYTKMQEMVHMAFANTNPTNCIDVYVDVFDMLKPIYSRDVYATKQFVIVSSVINLCAHIRGYFRTRHHMYTRIFLVYGTNMTQNHKQFYASFGDDSYRQTMDFQKNNTFIESQLELVKILAAYIDNVYFVEKHTMFPIFVYDNILKNKCPAIVLTKNTYAYQIPALTNAALFRPRKHNSEDTSFPVYGGNVLYQYYSGITSAKTIEYLSMINPAHLGLLMTITGNSQYNMKGVTNTTAAVRMVSNAIKSERILNTRMTDPNYIYNSIPEISKYIDESNFIFRFNAIDLPYQHLLYTMMPESLDYSWMIDLKDPETVRHINDKYFYDNPLDLNYL